MKINQKKIKPFNDNDSNEIKVINDWHNEKLKSLDVSSHKLLESDTWVMRTPKWYWLIVNYHYIYRKEKPVGLKLILKSEVFYSRSGGKNVSILRVILLLFFFAGIGWNLSKAVEIVWNWLKQIIEVKVW